jgi:hypothetical protein
VTDAPAQLVAIVRTGAIAGVSRFQDPSLATRGAFSFFEKVLS